jgi:DNA-binding transcriptional MerR regulator
MNYSRKSLANKMGIGIDTLRYYEKIKLVPNPDRGKNGYRIYHDEDVNRLKLIIKAKKYGFTLEEIKTILKISKNNGLSKDDIIQMIQHKMKDVDKQIIELNELKQILYAGLKTIQE